MKEVLRTVALLSVAIVCHLPLDALVRRHSACKQICVALSVLADLLSGRAYLADETCCGDKRDRTHMSPRAILPAFTHVATEATDCVWVFRVSVCGDKSSGCCFFV